QATLSTDPELVPTLDQIDPERCYLSWTITVQTDAAPDRLHEVFLFFSEDSTVAIEQRADDGRWLPVPEEPSIAVAPAGYSGDGVRGPAVGEVTAPVRVTEPASPSGTPVQAVSAHGQDAR